MGKSILMRVFRKLLTEEGIKNQKKIDILRNNNLNISLINLEAGQVIDPHPEPYAVFFFVIKGEINFLSDEETHKLSEGSAFYYEPDEIRGMVPLSETFLLGIQIFSS